MKVALLFMPCSVKDSCRHADFSRNRTWPDVLEHSMKIALLEPRIARELSTNGVAMTTISVGQTRLLLFFLKICKMKRNINLRTGLPLNFS